MDNQNKNYHFHTFLASWQKKFKQIPHILNLISSYPAINKHFENINFQSIDEIEKSQQEWIALFTKLEHPLETDFFKPYWVPIDKNSYDYFIDLSSGAYSIFQVSYYPFEPYGWLKKYLFHDVSRLFQSLEDDSINLEKELEENEIDFFNSMGDLMIKREELGLAGKIKPPDVEPERLFNEEIELSICYSDSNTIEINGASPFVASLFPSETQIKLINFTLIDTNNASEYIEQVTTIQTFVFLLSMGDNFRLESFEFQFVPKGTGYVKWENEILEIAYSDKNILNNIQTILNNNRIFND